MSKTEFETAQQAAVRLALSPELYPIAAVYTHVAAAMALINMKRIDESRVHMDKA